jgi:dihydroorotate dehydrogenase (NAD+) catalytic subunit
MPRQDLYLTSPWMNSAGSLGFLPPAAWNWPEPQGAFVTNPISLNPRTPAEERACLETPGGFLLHTGWPNPGLRALLKSEALCWAAQPLPVWVHLLGDEVHAVERMVRAFEEVEGAAAIELGLPPRAQPAEWLELAQAGLGELPLVVCVPVTAAGEPWVERLPGLGVSAVCLTAPRGSLPAGGRFVSGRYYGPALLPLAFEALRRLGSLGLPLIAGCGVDTPRDGAALLAAGAWAVQVDAALWQVR